MDLDSRQHSRSGESDRAFDLLILSDIRFVREGLAAVLEHDGTFQIIGVAVDIVQACSLVGRPPPRVILVDTSLPQGIAAVGSLRQCACDSEIVAFALTETEAEVIAWAQAGIDGYIPRNTPLSGIVGLLNDIVQGEQACPTRIASGLLRWISRHSVGPVRRESEAAQVALTAREHEVAHLIGAGMSNKEIARHLAISVATTKTHVHNILVKLGVRKRALAAGHLRERHDRQPRRPSAALGSRPTMLHKVE
jgi:two-component system, NarL family, nitrate/nitrite response regulator NarL